MTNILSYITVNCKMADYAVQRYLVNIYELIILTSN